jgi:hypothetical protein
MNPFPVVRATIARHRGTYVLFIALVAAATAIGVAITTQEAALRKGSARAADKFDLVVAAPGSETDVVVAAIYLRPGTVPLLDPSVTGMVLVEPQAVISAPLGFGDNIRGAPPIEFVWRVHGLPAGHAEGESHIGPPFDAARVPGVPAIVLKPRTVNAAYGLRNLYRTPLSMAFFPAEALVRLYEVLSDIRELMSWLALATQGVVVIAMLAGVMAILTLHRRQFAVLRALGAPRLYIFLCVWTQIAVIAVAGALIGLGLGAGAAIGVSHLITRATGIALPARIGPDELLLVAGMIVFGLIVATVPAFISYRRSVIQSLTAQ